MTNVWQTLTVLLCFGLVICIVVLTAQISEKNDALLKVEELRRQQVNGDSEIQRLTANVQTLEKEKGTLSSENRKLKGQLAEKDTEIQELTSKVRALKLLVPKSESLSSGSPDIAGMVSDFLLATFVWEVTMLMRMPMRNQCIQFMLIPFILTSMK